MEIYVEKKCTYTNPVNVMIKITPLIIFSSLGHINVLSNVFQLLLSIHQSTG
jgi:hypothetical protein